jgi:hypothetical protein
VVHECCAEGEKAPCHASDGQPEAGPDFLHDQVIRNLTKEVSSILPKNLGQLYRRRLRRLLRSCIESVIAARCSIKRRNPFGILSSGKRGETYCEVVSKRLMTKGVSALDFTKNGVDLVELGAFEVQVLAGTGDVGVV